MKRTGTWPEPLHSRSRWLRASYGTSLATEGLCIHFKFPLSTIGFVRHFFDQFGLQTQ